MKQAVNVKVKSSKGMNQQNSVQFKLCKTTIALAISALSGFGMAPIAFAQGAPAPADAEEIIVTGTLIRGVAPVGAPVMTLGEEEIRESGLTSASDLLRTLPQVLNLGANSSYTNTSGSGTQTNQTVANGTNLRGLGTQSTLTLIDGHRSAPAGPNGQLFDASTVPVSAISRLEVVADGASAIYGSEAVGGVVNIILRKNFESAETKLSYGSANNTHTWNASQTFGKAWGSGNFTGTLERTKSSQLNATDRPQFYNSDLRAYGVPLVAAAYIAYPGNIQVTTGTVSGVACSTAAPCYFGIPSGQNGSNLTGANLPTTPGTAANNYAGVNVRNIWNGATALPRQQRDTIVLAGEQNLNDWLSVFGEGLYTKRSFHFVAPVQAVTLRIPNSNPNSPCNLSKTNRPSYCGPLATSTLTVLYHLAPELGVAPSDGDSKNTTLTTGLDAKLAKDWKAEIAFTYSKNEDYRLGSNQTNTNASNPDVTANATFLNGFNPFIGDGSANASNQALVDKIRAYSIRATTYVLKDTSARLDGSLFEMPAGKVRLAVGTEYRSDGLKSFSDSTSGTDALNTSTPSVTVAYLKRSITAYYAELFVPILNSGAQKLNLSLAARREKYSDFGSTSNPKVGLSFTVVEGLKLNASYGTSYRAPALTEVLTSQGPATSYPSTILTSSGSNTTGTVLRIGGGNPDLKSETAKTWSSGFAWRPASLSGLELTANYYNIAYKDRISSPGASNNQVLIDPSFSSLILAKGPVTQADYDKWINYATANNLGLQTTGACTPLPSCLAGIIDGRLINAGRLETNGLDLSARYDWDTSLGTWTAAANLSRTLHWKVGLTSTSTLDEKVGLNNDAYPVKNRGRLQLGWKNAAWQVSSFFNYVGEYTNNTLATPEPVASYTTVDLSSSYNVGAVDSLLKGIRVGLNVRNLFDKDPPFVKFLGSIYTTFDPQNASALGRQITLQVTKNW